ncbi:hypothetical protein ESY86_19760 [Subsaximicrobium wynnwilliamsii]|uniref:Uncharacterized protein n=1 Tax=Subsaximicrobium wynnwilliamsii TaxID=291179 RepID=A0A5C6ZCA8_9FLAO|nr:hypothetical protein [Subsaximicrobium wynnwilliamsii]TXD80921.1 hypothetical protein ESY87_19840 [Subsaximicrobium wynnwilliamsii]TXD86607.1 hypothetical protein ESY86_19760 [Subsaximicrobium wynnwilliamsii]TXE00204.1 hypothetical protein ESY88_19820 [Subsaximicrobium wynnwilliamsii]
MKKILVYLLFVTLPLLSYSQSEPNLILDEKNGFKDLKIGDNYSKWSSDLTLTNTDNGIKYYDFIGSCCKKLFSSDLEKIGLGFKNNILDVIFLTTPTERDYSESWTSSEYRYLKGSFGEVLEEKAYESAPDDNSGDINSIWLGNKIQLILTFEYMGLKDFDGKYIKTSRCKVLISKRPDLKSGF